MFLTTGVSLYTSRVVLNTLGAVDFGIYNVVGGVVMMLSFLNSSMSLATFRFLSFELGKDDTIQFKKVFSMSVNIHAFIAITILVLAETIGLWFLNAKLNIPAERMGAANWVYQFSILSFMLMVMRIPYNAVIIAHERMKVYAYVTMLEGILKLAIVFALVFLGFDKLKLYAVLTFLVSVIIWIVYSIYFNRNFPKTRFILFWEHSLFKDLINYAGWNLFGFIGSVTMEQGISILLNLFFGSIANAARGIAYQVKANVNAFVFNFQLAIYPQIIKSYAAKDLKYMHQLIFQGSKYSFYLLYFISLPILLETETILSWWLKIVPDNTVIFCRLVLISTLIDSISGTLLTASEASGKIKKFQLVIGILLMLSLPISYIFLKIGFPAPTVFYVTIAISIVGLFARLKIISQLVNLSVLNFTRQVLYYLLIVTLTSIMLPLIIKLNIHQKIIQFLTVGFASSLSVAASIYYLGLKKEEQLLVKNKVWQFVAKIKRN
jgi:O-antigen/teichoic acid export membrane protein